MTRSVLRLSSTARSISVSENAPGSKDSASRHTVSPARFNLGTSHVVTHCWSRWL